MIVASSRSSKLTNLIGKGYIFEEKNEKGVSRVKGYFISKLICLFSHIAKEANVNLPMATFWIKTNVCSLYKKLESFY